MLHRLDLAWLSGGWAQDCIGNDSGKLKFSILNDGMCMRNSKIFSGGSIFDDVVKIKWGWFVALGVATLILGILAFGNLTLATSISVFYVGIFMALTGLLQVIHAFQFTSWSRFFYFILSGILYGAAGIVTFENPTLAAATLTLLLSLALIASGTIRIWSSMRLRSQSGWGWIFSSGLITLAAGIIFIVDWPVNSLWLLGMVLAVDLTFQGIAAIMLGLNLNSSKASTKIFERVTASV